MVKAPRTTTVTTTQIMEQAILRFFDLVSNSSHDKKSSITNDSQNCFKQLKIQCRNKSAGNDDITTVGIAKTKVLKRSMDKKHMARKRPILTNNNQYSSKQLKPDFEIKSKSYNHIDKMKYRELQRISKSLVIRAVA